ncbi:hypothetical protein [Sphingopyxis sp. 113P3]|uniref:hypothetical protein n=1 Tax=Sphingopyxis sp. (strain 113P3) TaxID=292913 RepID=UPI00130E9D78|nr:hypothetical protein [Sphingopyxis sp. 113P3]
MQVTQAEADRALKWINHNLMLAKGLMKSSSEAGNGAENFRAHDAHQALTAAKNAIMAWNTRAAFNGEGADEDTVERVARIIAPSAWAVFDAEKARMLRKYKGENIGWPADQYQHKASMDTARQIIASLNPSQDGESSTASSVDVDPSKMSVEMAELFGLVCKLSRLRTEHDDALRSNTGHLEAIEQAANKVDQIVDAIPELKAVFAKVHERERQMRAALALSTDKGEASRG